MGSAPGEVLRHKKGGEKGEESDINLPVLSLSPSLPSSSLPPLGGDIGQFKELNLHRLILQQQQAVQRAQRDSLFISQLSLRTDHLRQRVAARKRPSVPMLAAKSELKKPCADLGSAPSVACSETVPIRLDIDLDGYKLRDTFLWNMHDESLSFEHFAEMTCRDFDLPPAIFIPSIARSIRDQIHEHREASNLVRSAGGLAALEGIRALIRIDITVGFLQVVDQVEWDLGAAYNSSSTFAAGYVKDLALPAEFVTAIATDILEQVEHIRRALLLVGFQREAATGAIKVNDPEIQNLILPPIKPGQTRRDPNLLNNFTPIIAEIDPIELEKIEQSRDREARRKRRQTRGRRAGSELAGHPSSSVVSMANWTQISPPKTIRTPLSYRGSIHRVINRVDDDDSSDAPLPGTRSASARTRKSKR